MLEYARYHAATTTIIWRIGGVTRSRTCLNGLPDDAPQEVKDLAAQHWTPEVIQFAKDRLAGVRPKEA